MLFLTFVFVFIFIWTVIDSARMRDPVVFVGFTILYIAHLVLHWTSLYWQKRGWSVYLYLGLQSILVFALVLLAMNLGPLFGLYMGMIGESAGLLQRPWKIAGSVVFFLALSAGNYLLLTGGSDLQWWVLAIFPMTIFVILYVLLYSRQAEARERAQKLLVELEAANRQLTEYADRIEDLTLVNERARMARELHDTLAQGLAGLILQLEAADSHLAGNRPDRAREIIDQAMVRARSTLADSRRVIDNLRSGKWYDSGLTGAIRAEVERFQSSTSVPCSLEMDIPDLLMEPQRDLIYRVVTEGLSNIARHARARSAAVAIHTKGKTIEIAIRDDGAGFDPGAIPSGHYGLLGLRERARHLDGSVEISSSPAEGTLLRVHLPVMQKNDTE